MRTKEALAKSGTEKSSAILKKKLNVSNSICILAIGMFFSEERMMAESALDEQIGATRGRLWNVTI